MSRRGTGCNRRHSVIDNYYGTGYFSFAWADHHRAAPLTVT